MIEPHPEARLVSWLCAVIGTFITTDITTLTIGAMLTCCLLAMTRQLSRYLTFATLFLVPFSLFSIVLWSVVIGAPPDLSRGTAPHLGLLYAIRISLRLSILASISQAAFLTMSTEALWPAASRLGLRGTGLAIVLSSFALASTTTRIVDQTVTALKARGAIRPNHPWTKLAILPALIANLWNRLLAEQIQRVELKWAPQHTLDRATQVVVPIRWSGTRSFAMIGAGVIWLIIGAWGTFNG